MNHIGRRIVLTPESTLISGKVLPIAKDRVIYGLRFGLPYFQTADELKQSQHQILQAINGDLGLDSQLNKRIAVVKNQDGKTCILYIEKEAANEQEINVVVAEINKKGWKLPDESTQAYFCSSSVVTSLTHGHLNSGQSKNVGVRKVSSLFSEFKDIVSWGCSSGADDIDFIYRTTDAYSPVAFKIEGRWHKPERFLIPTETMGTMLGAAWQESQGGKAAAFDAKTVLQANLEIPLVQTKYLPSGGRVRLRWSSLPNEKGSTVTCRIQRMGQTARIKSLEEAGYSAWCIDAMRRARESKGGMVTFAGRVGSGKTTALAILLSEISGDMKIQTAEDPVEIDIPGAHQRTLPRDLSGADDDTAFNSTMMAVLRSALDIFYQSEIRDVKSGKLARQVLESGHGVYTTTHARSGLSIINRFTSPEIGIPKEVLGLPDGLKTNIFQAMLSKTCPHCGKSPNTYAQEKKITGDALEVHKKYFGRIESIYGIDSETFRLRDESGCDKCRRSDLPTLNGFLGRTPVCEIVEFNDEMLELVYKGDDYGLISLWRSLSDKKYDSDNLAGKTALECAIYKASQGLIDPREIEPEFASFQSIERNQRKSIC